MAAVCLLFCMTGVASAAVCVDEVRGRAGASGDCALVDGWWSDPVASVAEGLAAAGAGDEVWVAEGTYAEDGLVVPADVALRGGFRGNEETASAARPGERATRLRPAAPAGEATLAVGLEPGATLSGMRVTSGDPALGTAVARLCPGAGATSTVTLAENELHDSAVGIDVTSCDAARTTLVLRRNRVHGNGTGLLAGRAVVDEDELVVDGEENSWFDNGAAVVFEESSSFGRSTDVQLAGETVVSNGGGFSIGGSGWSATFASTNLLLQANRGSGLWFPYNLLAEDLLEEVDFGWYYGIATRGSTIAGNGEHGFAFGTDAGGDIEIERSTISGNGGDGINVQTSSGGAPALDILQSVIAHNQGAGLTAGFQRLGPLSLRRSVFTGNEIGVELRTTSFPPGSPGLIGGADLDRNDFSGNRTTCLRNDGYDVVAEWNFWGADDASSIASCIDGEMVDFDPWYWPASGDPADGPPRRVEARPEVSADVERPAYEHDRPAPGSFVTVTWVVDTATAQTSIGSFGGALRWDPWVLRFVDWETGDAGFDDVVCNEAEAADGRLRCSGTNTAGAEGRLELVCARFEVLGPERWVSPLDLEWSSLYAAADAAEPYEDLLPLLITRDDFVGVAPVARIGDVLANERIDSGDALVVLSEEVELPVPEESARRLDERLADANGDGTTDSTDANVLLSYEVGLETPRPAGERNVFDDRCGEAVLSAAAEPQGPVGTLAADLIFDRAQVAPGETVRVQAWLTNTTSDRLGSYTGTLRWPAGRYRLVSIAPGDAEPLARPKINGELAGEGRALFAAAAPHGNEATSVLLVVAELEALVAGTPTDDVTADYSAVAGISPGFASLRETLEHNPPRVREPRSAPRTGGRTGGR